MGPRSSNFTVPQPTMLVIYIAQFAAAATATGIMGFFVYRLKTVPHEDLFDSCVPEQFYLVGQSRFRDRSMLILLVTRCCDCQHDSTEPSGHDQGWQLDDQRSVVPRLDCSIDPVRAAYASRFHAPM